MTPTLTPIQNEAGVHVNSITDTTYQQSLANALQAAQTNCKDFNAQLKDKYLGLFNLWAKNIDIGRPDGTKPPQPPASYVVDYFTDSTSSSTQIFKWPFPSQVGPPVCEVPPLPPESKPYVPPVIAPPANIRNVPLGDLMPVGFTITMDGATWQKQSSPTPFGTAYFYARIG